METLGSWVGSAELHTNEFVEKVLIEPYERGDEQERRLLSRDEWFSDPWYSRPFSAGYGGTGCPSLVAWTQNWVFYTHEYDGATSLCKLPRNPTIPAKPVYYGDVWQP